MRFFALAALLFFAFKSFGGGGWIRPSGKLFLKLGNSQTLGNTYFDQFGRKRTLQETYLSVTSLYGEMGLGHGFEAGFYFPFFTTLSYRNFDLPSGRRVFSETFHGLGDTELYMKYGKEIGGFHSSLSMVLGIPSGFNGKGISKSLQSGDDEFNQALKLDVSRSLPTLKSFSSIFIAYNRRAVGFSDEIWFGFELGTEFMEDFFFLIKSNNTHYLESPNRDRPLTPNFTNFRAFNHLTTEAIIPLGKSFGLSISATFVLKAEKQLAAPSVGAGIFWNNW